MRWEYAVVSTRCLHREGCIGSGLCEVIVSKSCQDILQPDLCTNNSHFCCGYLLGVGREAVSFIN